MDEIATKLDATTVLQIELEAMRRNPSATPTAHSGWSVPELVALRQAYSVSTAQRMIAAAEKARRPMDADPVEPPPAKQGTVATLEGMLAAMRKARGED